MENEPKKPSGAFARQPVLLSKPNEEVCRAKCVDMDPEPRLPAAAESLRLILLKGLRTKRPKTLRAIRRSLSVPGHEAIHVIT